MGGVTRPFSSGAASAPSDERGVRITRQCGSGAVATQRTTKQMVEGSSPVAATSFCSSVISLLGDSKREILFLGSSNKLFTAKKSLILQ